MSNDKAAPALTDDDAADYLDTLAAGHGSHMRATLNDIANRLRGYAARPAAAPVAWICDDDWHRLREHGCTTVYEHEQRFSLMAPVGQTPLYASPPPAEPPQREETLYPLLASAWFYGNWKAETMAERTMEQIMVRAGWWPFASEGELIAKLCASPSAAEAKEPKQSMGSRLGESDELLREAQGGDVPAPTPTAEAAESGALPEYVCAKCGFTSPMGIHRCEPKTPPVSAPASDGDLVARMRKCIEWERDGGNGGTYLETMAEAAFALEVARTEREARDLDIADLRVIANDATRAILESRTQRLRAEAAEAKLDAAMQVIAAADAMRQTIPVGNANLPIAMLSVEAQTARTYDAARALIAESGSKT